MTKTEYVQKLREYTEKAKISIYDYYLSIANQIRSGEKFSLMPFELSNPFTTEDNIQKLLYATDPKVAEYYADIMTKAVSECEVQSRKNMIREGLTEAMDETISKADMKNIIDGLLDKEPKKAIKMTSIHTENMEELNGFTVLREGKEGQVHLFYYDGKNKSLRGEMTMPGNSLRVGSGYYINYEEFMSQMIDELSNKYPNVEEIEFVKGEQVMTLPMVMEEVYVEARKRGILRFGKALETQELEHYQEVAANPKRVENYNGNPLQTGVYVPRALLADLLSQYKAKLTVIEEEKEPTK